MRVGACADDKASGIGNGISLSQRSQDTKRLSTPAAGRQRIEMQTNPLAAQLILSCDDSRQSRTHTQTHTERMSPRDFFLWALAIFLLSVSCPFISPTLSICAARSVSGAARTVRCHTFGPTDLFTSRALLVPISL